MAIAVVCFSFGNLPLVYSCGPFFPETIFSYKYHPDFPLDGFAKGQLGVMKPTYAASYLVVAYRYLMGIGLGKEEQQAMVVFWKERLHLESESESDSRDEWLREREKVPGHPSPENLGIYREVQKYQSYLNCNEDAFTTATQTLKDRINEFGVRSAEVEDWLQAQDMVFANCSKGQTIPPLAAPERPPLIKADRAYQIAAAYFYSGDFDTAEKMFKEISEDPSSSWREVAPYLAVRAIIRKASLSGEEGKNDTALLASAESGLMKILTDKSLSKIHPASEKLLDLVQCRMDPEKKFIVLSVDVLKKQSADQLKTKLSDYIRFLGLLKIEKPDDLTDWILTFQGGTLEHSIMKWREKKTLPWLVASLSKIDTNHAELPELLLEAEKIKPSSPAYPSVIYHQLRLSIDSGRKEEARRRLEDFLLKERRFLPPSSLNLFLVLRMKLAQNLDEFLTYAKQIPVGIFYDYDGKEVPRDLETDKLKSFGTPELFDRESVGILNGKIPLSVMKEAVKRNVLPEHLRKRVALSAWVRAVLLEKGKIAEGLASLIQNLMPELKKDFAKYLSEKNIEDRRFEAVLLILRNPGIQPYLREGIGRLDPVGKIDNLRDNWWCSLEEDKGPDGRRLIRPARGLPEMGNGVPEFLNESETKEAEEEWNVITRIGAAPSYLCRLVIERVRTNPNDMRLPEALHLAVRSTRYGCPDKANGELSRTAFSILHQQYPKNPWAKRTPYWFN